MLSTKNKKTQKEETYNNILKIYQKKIDLNSSAKDSSTEKLSIAKIKLVQS